MLQTGIVQDKNKNIAHVKITRSSACGDSCASCNLCSGNTITIEAENSVHALAGDTVFLDMADKKVLGAAFLVYIVPLFSLRIGFCIGFAAFGSENRAILCGFLLFALTFAVIIAVDKKIKKGYIPKIVEIIASDNTKD
jgi:sigma-E factor negative regulatory protein RseC